MHGVPPLLEPIEGPFTMANIGAAKTTVRSTYYKSP